jgi:iron(III) transport system substrate-binding protein
LESFTKETGIKVNFVRLATGEAAARIEAEKNRPQAALWLGGVGLGPSEAKTKGLTTPYQSPMTQKIPSQLKDPQGYWNGLYRGILAFVTNKDQLAQKKLTAPTSWQELTDAHWKGLIQIPNPGTSGTSYNLITTLIQSMGEEKAFEYMKALHKNVSQYTKSGAAPTKNVALGESVVAIGYFHDIIRLTEESKAPLQVTFPKEGTGYEIAAVSMIKNGPSPELAGKLIDWMYSKTASQILADHYYVPISLEGVSLREQARIPQDLKLIDTNIDWAGQNKQRLIDLWNSKINT